MVQPRELGSEPRQQRETAVSATVGVDRDAGSGLPIVSLTLTQPSLDDVFLDVTGQRFVGAGAPTLTQGA